MKLIVLLATFLSLASSSYAKNLTVQAHAQLKKGKVVELIIQGSLEKDSYIYSVSLKPKRYPIPTSLKLDTKKLMPIGDTEESQPSELYDPFFKEFLLVHKDRFQFKQDYRLVASSIPQKITGYLNYQICKQKICSLPKKLPFSFSVDNLL